MAAKQTVTTAELANAYETFAKFAQQSKKDVLNAIVPQPGMKQLRSEVGQRLDVMVGDAAAIRDMLAQATRAYPSEDAPARAPRRATGSSRRAAARGRVESTGKANATADKGKVAVPA